MHQGDGMKKSSMLQRREEEHFVKVDHTFSDKEKKKRVKSKNLGTARREKKRKEKPSCVYFFPLFTSSFAR